MKVRLAARAVSDLEQAADHYDGQVAGLGAEFLRAFDTALERLQLFPEGAPPVDGFPGVRRARVRRFPYGVFYRPEAEELIVLRVHHARRDRTDWDRS